jgi:hypothetical protein
MKTKVTTKLPPKTFLYLLICIGGILAFVFLAIYPHQKASAKLDEEIERVSAQIEVQRTMFPLYKDLMERLQSNNTRVLPFPQKTDLRQDNIESLPVGLREIAEKSKVKVQDFRLDMNSLSDESAFLTAVLVMHGEFFDFREFLNQLGGIEYLDHIQQIKMHTIQGSEELELIIKICMAKADKK